VGIDYQDFEANAFKNTASNLSNMYCNQNDLPPHNNHEKSTKEAKNIISTPLEECFKTPRIKTED